MAGYSVNKHMGSKSGINSNFANVNGVTLKSFLFDGSDERFEGANINNFDKTDLFAGSFWIKLNTVGVNHIVCAKRNPTNKGYVFYVTNSDEIAFIFGGSSSDRIFVKSTETLSVDTWYNIMFSYNGNGLANGVSMYINNSVVTPVVVNDTLTSSQTNSQGFNLGWQFSINLPFDGYMLQAVIKGNKFSSTDRSELYNGGCPLAKLNAGTLTNYNDYNSLWNAEDDFISDYTTNYKWTDSKNGDILTSQNMEESDYTDDNVC